MAKTKKQKQLPEYLIFQRNYLINVAYQLLGISMSDIALIFRCDRQLVFKILNKPDDMKEIQM